jgi:signal transduction histidine kinase
MRTVADVVRHDPAIVARLIALANSSAYNKTAGCSSISDAISLLGIEAVKTVVVTTARRQFLEDFNAGHTEFLKAHWQRSLLTARLALEFASLTIYTSPDEVYLSGLLADVGQLVNLTHYDVNSRRRLRSKQHDSMGIGAKTASYPEDVCAAGAGLFDDRQVSFFVTNAIRYHRERPGDLQGAHHLVKLIKLAGLLGQRHNTASKFDSEELTQAHGLLGLDEEITREVVGRVSADVGQIAIDYGVEVGEENADDRQAQKELGERLSMLADIITISNQLSNSKKNVSSQKTLQNSLLIIRNIRNPLLFMHREDLQALEAYLSVADNRSADFKIPEASGISVISDCYVQQSLKLADLSQPRTIVDRQIIEYIGTGNLFCVPLTHHQHSIGVLAFGDSGLAPDEFKEDFRFYRLLAAEITRHLVADQVMSARMEGHEVNEDGVELRVLEVVHEISNPLTIILNYLEILRMGSAGELDDDGKIEHIKEEVEGVRKILRKLSSPKKIEEPSENLHQVIKSLTEAFRISFLGAKKIDIILTLDKETENVNVDSVLFRQVLTNLLKNAAEALQTRGKILVTTESNISVGGECYFAIYVHDNGPGISGEIRKILFSPMKSTKGIGHSGLGLSIVKNLLDGIDGTIVCRSNADSRIKSTGTQFQILIPNSAG